VKAFAFVNNFKLVPAFNKINTDHLFEVVDVPPEQPALVTHSSGSTGNAKAIYRSHKVLLSQHHVLRQVFPPLPNQVDFPLFPNILLHNLALGVTSVLPDIPHFKLKEMQPARIVDQLIHQRIETATGNVFYFDSIIKHLHKHAVTFPHVRAIGIGGSPVPDTLALALKKFFIEAAIYIIYGSSEAEPIAVRKIDDETIHPFAGYKVGDIVPQLQLEMVPLGEVIVGSKKVTVGEIKVKGAHVATNNKDEALHTGDFGYVDEKNQLYLTARKGNEKICGGYQHYQLEHLLTNDSRVEKVAAIAGDDGFVIYVQGNISKQEILNTLITYMPAQLVKSIHLRNDIPVDARHLSKILYHKVS
jgi:acyl-CoA synthetase (AMP-forming)/AMP-acid ligase II